MAYSTAADKPDCFADSGEYGGKYCGSCSFRTSCGRAVEEQARSAKPIPMDKPPKEEEKKKVAYSYKNTSASRYRYTGSTTSASTRTNTAIRPSTHHVVYNHKKDLGPQFRGFLKHGLMREAAKQVYDLALSCEEEFQRSVLEEET